MEGAIIGLLGSILVVVVSGFSALWYRQGKLESRMAELEARIMALERIEAGITGHLNQIETRIAEHLDQATSMLLSALREKG